jgi:hypothetical protein
MKLMFAMLGSNIDLELPTNLLSCVNKTATPASTLPTVKDTNIMKELDTVLISMRRGLWKATSN